LTAGDPNAQPTIRIVVVDDHEMVLDAVVRNLSRQPDMTVAAAAATIADALAAVERLAPDIVVLDYQLPDGDGASAAKQIVTTWPTIRVVMLTGSNDDAAIFEAARSGCAGYVDKTSAPEELVRVIRSVHQGSTELPARLLERLPSAANLVVHYQPIVDLTSRQIMGFEALVRWVHPNRGLILPGDFIPLAERTDRIIDIDQYVRTEACLQANDWNRRFPSNPIRFVSVNLSGRELQLPDFTHRIEHTLAQTNLAPTALIIEVTETYLVQDDPSAARGLAELSRLGVRTALDDFGTGYSSLAYLRRFPIDIIKLDKSFTEELPHGARALTLLDALGRLATDLGAATEAEGIETSEQAECLVSLGWQLGQGYYFGRPLDSSATDGLLASE